MLAFQLVAPQLKVSVVLFVHMRCLSAIKKVIQKNLIKNCTDGSGNMNTRFKNKTIHGKTYSVKEVSDMAAQIHEKIPTVARLEKNGSAVHFVTVVGTDTSQSGKDVYQVKDPGKRANSTLKDAMDNYPGCTLNGKFIIE